MDQTTRQATTTKVRYNRFLQEYCVHVYDQHGKAMPDAMYFTNDKDDAEHTARALVTRN